MQLGNVQIISREDKRALIAECKTDLATKQIFFAVEQKNQQYLDDKSADAFVLAAIIPAMLAGEDLEVDWPMSEQFKYNLETYLIPWLLKVNKNLSPSQIVPKQGFTQYQYDSKGSGTGISCGIDSFYTVLKLIQPNVPEELRLTHTILNQHVFKDSFDTADPLEIPLKDQKRQQVSQQLGLASIYVWTNVDQFINLPFEQIGTFHDLAVALSLKKLLRRYSYATSDPWTEFEVTFNYSQLYDFLNASAIRTESFQMHSHGVHETRMDKTEYLANQPIVRQYLNVCLHQNHGGPVVNCTNCEKCIRTATALDILGVLSAFNQVFDIDYFRRNRARLYGEVVYRAIINRNVFDRSILKKAKLCHQSLPLSRYYWMMQLGTRHQLAKLMKKTSLI